MSSDPNSLGFPQSSSSWILGLLRRARRYFLRPSTLIDRGKDEVCGHGSRSFGGGMTSAFAGIRQSLAVLSMSDFLTLGIGRVKRGMYFARRANAFVSEVDCVQRSMLRSKTLSNKSSLAMLVSMISI